ncbi:hypothetical protein MKZ38_008726 [Zalerion maritima]|uniref:Transmembrane protein n=1 Tax=Zalerion maritima TaxID=339359 RepID=A0AAD5RH42_9PEZI|nr:hypothetical protein MKZ38_008726 [Zalerion maritima]
MLARRMLELVLLFVFALEFTAANARGRCYRERRGTEPDTHECIQQGNVATQEQDANAPGDAGEGGTLGVRRGEDSGGSDNIPAAPHTASSIIQPTGSSTPNKRSTAAPLSSTTPPARLETRQHFPIDDPVGTISQLSRSLSLVSSSASSAISSISSSAFYVSQSFRQSLDNQQRSANTAVQSAQSSARSAITSTVGSLSVSASIAMASLSASASSAQSRAASSAANSVSMALASAWQAVESASSDVQSARLKVATVRAEASNQIHQAQGAVVSVTQAALGIVGAIIGSSILSILTFYLILRYRKQKRKERAEKDYNRKPAIGYPQPSPYNGLEPSSFTAPPTRTVLAPRKLQSRARTTKLDTAPRPPGVSRIDTARATQAPSQAVSNYPSGVGMGATLSPRTAAVGYATSDYASGNWPIKQMFSLENGTMVRRDSTEDSIRVRKDSSDNTTMVRTPSSTGSAPNFSRRQTRAVASAPLSSEERQRRESEPSVEPTFVPGHSRSGSTSTLVGSGVGSDLRSPLRRNVVSLFPRPRDGGGVKFVRPENRVSANGGMKDAPLPPPPTFDGVDRLSRVSEENRLSAAPNLELRAGGKVSPFKWP